MPTSGRASRRSTTSRAAASRPGRMTTTVMAPTSPVSSAAVARVSGVRTRALRRRSRSSDSRCSRQTAAARRATSSPRSSSPSRTSGTLGIDIINISLGHPPLRVGDDRSARRCGSEGVGGWHSCRHVRRQLRRESAHGSSRVRRHFGARQLAFGADGWLRAHGRHPGAQRRHRRRRTARVARRGSTATRSRTSWRRGTGWLRRLALGSTLVLTYPTQLVQSVLNLFSSSSSNYLVLSGTSMAAAVTIGRRGADDRGESHGVSPLRDRAEPDAERDQGDPSVHGVRGARRERRRVPTL